MRLRFRVRTATLGHTCTPWCDLFAGRAYGQTPCVAPVLSVPGSPYTCCPAPLRRAREGCCCGRAGVLCGWRGGRGDRGIGGTGMAGDGVFS